MQFEYVSDSQVYFFPDIIFFREEIEYGERSRHSCIQLKIPKNGAMENKKKLIDAWYLPMNEVALQIIARNEEGKFFRQNLTFINPQDFSNFSK